MTIFVSLIRVPRWILKLAVTAALSVLVSERAAAQRYTYRQYGPQQGLTNLVVYCLLQDRAGYLWVGTDNGLFRYDGGAFQGYFRVDGLPSQVIRGIAESPTGELWVTTENGIARRVGNEFVPFTLGDNRKPLAATGVVFDRAGNFYFVQRSTGELVRGEPSPSGFQYSAIAAGSVTAIYIPPGGEDLWYARESGLTRLRLNRAAATSETYAGLRPDRWSGITEDASGDLWIRSETKLFVLPRGGTRFEDRSSGVPPCSAGVCRLSSDPREGVLVPGDIGLAVVGNKALHAAQGGPVRAAIVTRDGSLWMGTYGSGLLRRLGRGEWTSWQREDGLPNTTIWALLRDAAGSTWLGSNGGLGRLDRNGKFTGNWTTSQGLYGNRVEWVTQPSGSDTLYASTKPFGVSQIDAAAGLVIRTYGRERFEGAKEGAPPIGVDPQGRLWVVTEKTCFRSIESAVSHRELRFEPLGRDRLPEDARFTGAPSISGRDGAMLIGTTRGLARFLPQQNRWELFTAQDGLRNSPVEFAVERDGATWVRYSDSLGLTRLNLETRPVRVEHFDRSNGLVSDAVFGMAFDSGGRLWVSTDNGVDVRLQNGTWRHYGVADGLISGDCDEGALFADGESVWVGTSNGVSRYQPRQDTSPATSPILFSSIEGGGRHWLAGQEKPVLAYDRRSIRIQLGSPEFYLEPLRIRHRLAGADNNWLETRERVVQYSGLPAGDYRFEAMAVSAEGADIMPVSLEFSILPPWWQTWWFQGLGVVTILFLAKAAWRLRIRALLGQKKALEQEVALRTAELRESHRRLEEIAYLDSLTLLPNRRSFAEEFERRLALGSRHAESFALVLIDLDQFKPINDNYGHDAGDAVLVEMSRRMVAAVRAGDFVARLGGDEFGILLARADTEPSVDVVRTRIAQSFEQPIDFQGVALRVGLSSGMAIFPLHGQTQEQLFKVADLALYETKRQHRHTI